MYEIKTISEFSAAHTLRGYKGKCENLHGHNWKVEVMARSVKLDKLGMVMDFTRLKAALKSVLEELDHRNLNDLAYFKEVNPTSENIAKYVYDMIKALGCRAHAVRVWESDTACASYRQG